MATIYFNGSDGTNTTLLAPAAVWHLVRAHYTNERGTPTVLMDALDAAIRSTDPAPRVTLPTDLANQVQATATGLQP